MLTINLFDCLFPQSVCSVAHQMPTYIQYVRNLMDFDGITLFTDGHLFDPVVDEVRSKWKIAWLREPRCLHPLNYELAPTVMGKFDLFLTYDKELLKLPNARFCPYGGSWIPSGHWGLHSKTKLISMLIGDKMATEGHKLRHAVASCVPDRLVDFYGVRGEPVDYGWQTKKKVLADYAFTIVTETCQEDNLFTEILLDCFALGTIPIYWGAPNINQFFNRSGILGFHDADGVLHYLGRISFATHRARRRAIYTNLREAEYYRVTEDWMYKNIFKELL